MKNLTFGLLLLLSAASACSSFEGSVLLSEGGVNTAVPVPAEASADRSNLGATRDAARTYVGLG